MSSSESPHLSISAALFEESNRRFLNLSRDSIDRNHALHLARALGPFFFPFSVEVLWLPDEAAEGGGFSACGARWKLDVPVAEVAATELLGLVEGYRGRSQLRRRRDEDLELEFSDENSDTFVYVISKKSSIGVSASRVESLWLVVTPPEEAYPEARTLIEQRNSFLRLGSNCLETIHTTFVALHRPPWAAELSGEIRSFVGQVEMSPRERLERASGLMSNVTDIWTGASTLSSLRQARDILVSVVQSLVGKGVDVNSSLLDGCRQHANDFVVKVQVLVLPLQANGTDEAAQLATLCRTVQAIAADPEVCGGCTACQISLRRWNESPQGAERDLIDLDLLADWTGLHQHARGQRRKGPGHRESPREVWYPWAARTFGRLKRFLRGHFRSAMHVPYVPPWLRLWFCHDLLHQASAIESTVEAWSNWRFCEHLAYVVRESLRVFVYGDRADYFFRPPELAEALRTLVEHHALHVLRLPSDPDIRTLLNEVSSMHSSLGYFYVSGHLQHVLEVYIAGQFICNLRVEIGKGDEWTGEQILASRSAWKPLKLSTGEFRRAFSLAALLHDVGRLLLPQWRPTSEKWFRVDKTLLKNLSGVEDNLLDSLARLMTQCAQELEAEGYFDPASERAVRLWVEDRVDRRDIDFALVSAWFLHRLCQNVQGLQGDTVRQAVRAVLFHQMATQVVEVDRDPAAALLILCDQIFAWNANKIWVTPGETGHSFQAIAADVLPQPPLFELLELEGLQDEPDGGPDDKPLGFRIHGTEAGGFWPHFCVTLRKPEDLEVPLIWIGLAQSLCRIKPSGKHKWAPRVTVRSEIPEHMRSRKLCTFDLLGEVVSEGESTLRGALSRFISEAKPSKVGNLEQIELCPLGRPLHREDLSPLLPELQSVLEKVLSRRDGGK